MLREHREILCARVANRTAADGRSSSPLDMLDRFESLPFPATTLIVAIISVALTAIVTRLVPIWARWVAALIVPPAVAYMIYWMPVWLGRSAAVAEYSAWQLLVVGVWGIAGVAASLICVFLMDRHRRVGASHV